MDMPTEAGLAPDAKFLRNMGALLVLTAMGAGTMTVMGTYAIADAPMQISKAESLEKGTEKILQETARNVSERDVFNTSSTPFFTSIDEGD
jgi:hypothetical protein